MGPGNVAKQRKIRAGHVIRAVATTSTEQSASEITTSEIAQIDYTDISTSTIVSLAAVALTILGLFYYARSLLNECNRMIGENYRLRLQIRQLHGKLAKMCKRSVQPDELLKTDGDTAFYTGIEQRGTFEKLHDFVARFVRRRWRGFQYSCSIRRPARRSFRSPMKFGPQPKLTTKEEFMLTLMKLRLGLLNRDLAGRFNISTALCSKIVKTWLTAMRKTLGNLVFWPNKEQIIATKPARFSNLPDLRAIIDCSEIFIETPKDPVLQCATWSEYKHHNTIKFLIAVAPNSAITFLSKCYCGRASDRAVTLDCKFLDKLDMYDMIQADKGFNIGSDCETRLLSLDVPPGKRGAAQMSAAAVNKTKRIANLRILVEQVIRRLKTFRILQTELPISLLPCADDIVIVCAALCNLKKPIYNT